MPPPPLPPPLTDSGDKTLVVLCHLSLLLGMGFILPLIIFLVKRQDPSPVADHAREVLNFHISLVIYALVSLPLILILIGIPILILLGLASVVCAIIAAIKASEGGFYHYPLTLRFI